MGCPRSGTTALTVLLNSHPSVAVGIERYARRFLRSEFLDRSLYEPERFFGVKAGDTFYDDLDSFDPGAAALRAKYGEALYRGDKIPMLFLRLPQLLDAFGDDARIIFIFRNPVDVAASFKQMQLDPNEVHWPKDSGVRDAVKNWNAAIQAALPYLDDRRVQLVQYEALFQAGEGLSGLFAYLRLEVEPATDATFAQLHRRSDELERKRERVLDYRDLDHIVREADFTGFRKVLARCSITL